MISDLLIAENIKKLISKREKSDTHISIENKVFDGVRYITLTAMDNATFKKSYTWLSMIADILGIDDRKITWANPHFANEWEAIKQRLLDAINDDEKTPVVLSGHGVAGSVALMAGYYLTMRDKNLLRVVTFGAPAGLNRKKTKDPFCHILRLKTRQYAFARDPIANMFRWTKYFSLARTELKLLGRDSKKLSMESYATGLDWGWPGNE